MLPVVLTLQLLVPHQQCQRRPLVLSHLLSDNNIQVLQLNDPAHDKDKNFQQQLPDV